VLSLTFLLHTAVADWFLGGRRNNSQEWGRERLGGFLVFKLLLISAIRAPVTNVDFLIVLGWYTLLSCLRSLSHLCAETTQLTIQSGQAPRSGVLKLLLVVFFSDLWAASVCVALFHPSGWSIMLYLTFDCALLSVDVVSHILVHVGQVLEVQHAERVSALEARQPRFDQEHDEASANQAREIERQLEKFEQQQVRRTSLLETTVFCLQMLTHILTVGHYMHTWYMHTEGLLTFRFDLIDGVLALHLHSALSSGSKKVAERRNLHRIAREMDRMFDDASELELRKAVATGDVCCICLGTMTMGNVKKVGCAHLYHTSCLREVVERARSIAAARCPLCRASILHGHRVLSNREPNAANAETNNVLPIVDNMAQNRDTETLQNNNNNGTNGEMALFRFSTEGMFPEWLPVPAFSFEVVRRPIVAPQEINNANDNNGGAGNNDPRRSFMRRLLLLAGILSMSPQEEAAALEQLVDMFPQYDRADLLRELRRRRSSEAVAESILVGAFAGVARGEPNNWQAGGDAVAEAR
jgi:hypothetical protein